ncbi:MAG: MFS transporter [Pseudomonadota bacterium]
MRGALLVRLEPFRRLVPPIAAMSLFGVSMAMTYPLFALLLEREGISGTLIGVNAMAAAVAMVIGAPLLPMVMRRVGIGPLMTWACLVMAGMMAAIPILPDFWYWTVLRLIYGFAGTALFFAAEYWIVATAPNASRGRVIAIYAMIMSVSYMVGPLIVAATGVEGILPFAVATGVILVGLAPIRWGLSAAPAPGTDTPTKPGEALKFFRTDPTVLFAVLTFGMIEYGGLALLPVWAVRIGAGEDLGLLLLAAFPLGSVLLLWPMGWLADRSDRRVLLMLAGALSALMPLGMILWAPMALPLLAISLVWGGVAASLYAVSLTELGSRYAGNKLSDGNAAVVLAYGLGALVAPGLFGVAMDLVPPDGLLWAVALAAAGYAGIVAWRLRRRQQPGP